MFLPFLSVWLIKCLLFAAHEITKLVSEVTYDGGMWREEGNEHHCEIGMHLPMEKNRKILGGGYEKIVPTGTRLIPNSSTDSLWSPP